MSHILNLVYAFLAVMVVLPIVELRLLDARRARALRAFGAARGRHAVTLIEHEETLALLGWPFVRYTATPGAAELARALARVPPAAPLDLIVHLPRDASLDIGAVTTLLSAHPGPVTVIVPVAALTGGQTLARAGAELLLGAGARLAEADEAAIVAPAGRPPRRPRRGARAVPAAGDAVALEPQTGVPRARRTTFGRLALKAGGRR